MTITNEALFKLIDMNSNLVEKINSINNETRYRIRTKDFTLIQSRFHWGFFFNYYSGMLYFLKIGKGIDLNNNSLLFKRMEKLYHSGYGFVTSDSCVLRELERILNTVNS